jgi:hypothetical protein
MPNFKIYLWQGSKNPDGKVQESRWQGSGNSDGKVKEIKMARTKIYRWQGY